MFFQRLSSQLKASGMLLVSLHVHMWYLKNTGAGPHLWRNRLARSAVNRKVAGSSPARCDLIFFVCVFVFFFLSFFFSLYCSVSSSL